MMKSNYKEFFYVIKRIFAMRTAKASFFFAAVKIVIDIIGVIMPAVLGDSLHLLSTVLLVTTLVLWVWSVHRLCKQNESELSEHQRIKELTGGIGLLPFISLGCVVFTSLVEFIIVQNAPEMNLIQTTIMNVCMLGFLIVIGECSSITYRLLTIRRTQSTNNILKVLGVMFSIWVLLVFVENVSGGTDAPFFAIVGTFSAIWVFIRLRKIQWLNTLSRSGKISLLWRAGLSICVCMIMSGIMVDDTVSNQSGIRYVFPGLALYLAFVFSIAGAALTRLSISLLFSLPTAQFIDRRNYEVESLIELNRLALSETSIETIVETIMYRAVEATKAHAAWCEALDPNSSDYIVLASVNLNDEHIAWFHRFSEFEERVLRCKEQILLPNLDDDKELSYLTKFPKPLARSVLAAPLFSGAKRVAMLILVKQEQYGFQNDDLRLISAFQHNVKIAFDNARLLKESIENERIKKELSVASSIQQNLLPQKIPDIQGFDINIKCIPAAEVGGDYYDFVKLKNNKWCLIVGDVSGKGIPAAFYMAHVKGIVFTLAGMAENPFDFLTKVNSALYGNMERHTYITMSACMFDTDNKQLVIARAGHCPTFLKQSRAVAVLTPRGLGIGLAGESMFTKSLQELSVPYSEGDIAYFFTDGVSEAKNTKNDELGYEPILDVLRSITDVSSSSDINEIIMEQLLHFTEKAPQHDDITSVVVRCLSDKRTLLAQNSYPIIQQAQEDTALLEEHKE